jgi:hypothetical protein
LAVLGSGELPHEARQTLLLGRRLLVAKTARRNLVAAVGRRTQRGNSILERRPAALGDRGSSHDLTVGRRFGSIEDENPLAGLQTRPNPIAGP